MILQLIIITVVHNGAGRVIKKIPHTIPHASVVTPGTGVEPTPAFITNMTFIPEPRIVGGEPADITEFPFLVNIEYNRVHWCGGSYIQPTWILTAAHCLLNPTTRKPLSPEGYLVKMGATTLNDKTASSRRVLTTIPHVSFHTYNNSCDIGLIEIESPFGTSPKIAMIELPKHFSSYEAFDAAVAGWGVTRQEDMSNQRKHSQHLLKVTVPVIAQDSCRNLYSVPKYAQLFAGNKVLCAGYIEGGKDACQGDSGGPLVHNDVLIGIVSWGIGCGNEIPGVYTNVYYYLQWIKGSMSNTSFNLRKSHNNASPTTASKTIKSHIIFGVLCILIITS